MKAERSENKRGVLRATRGAAIIWGPSLENQPSCLLSWARADKTGQNRAQTDTPERPIRLFWPRRPRAKEPISADRIWRKAPQDNPFTAFAWVEPASRPQGIKDKKSRVLSDSRRTRDVYSQGLDPEASCADLAPPDSEKKADKTGHTGQARKGVSDDPTSGR